MSGSLALMRAAEAGQAHQVSQLLLLRQEQYVSRRRNSSNSLYTSRHSLGATALESASRQGHSHIVDLLLQHNHTAMTTYAALNATKRGGWSPLHSACLHGHVDVASKLLRVGADPTRRLSNGQSALHVACGAGHLALVGLLLEQPQWSWSSTSSSSSSMMLAATDNRGWTPLHTACFHGCVDIVQYLLTHTDVQVEAKDCNGCTPLQVAASQSRQDVRRLHVLQVLLWQPHSQRANINSTDDQGRTALEKAILRNDCSMVCCLLRCGARVRRIDLIYARHHPDALYALVRAAASQGFFS